MSNISHFEAIAATLIAIVFFDHLVIKHFVLKRIKDKHHAIWEQMGCPTVLSLKESQWALIGLRGEVDPRSELGDDETSHATRRWLAKYRLLFFFECGLAALAVVALFTS